jgi:hypothetical protein
VVAGSVKSGALVPRASAMILFLLNYSLLQKVWVGGSFIGKR